MAAKSNPAVLQRQLGAELRRLREASGRTAATAAAKLNWSESKLSRIETAHTGIRNADLDRLLVLYKVPESERAKLLVLAS